MSNFIDLAGQKFNRLTVIETAGKAKDGNYKWLCKCVCGKEVIVPSARLRKGENQSCGCLNKELTKERFTKHGKKNTRLYSIWCCMKSRCYNHKNTEYKNYGGRGIVVCEKWKNSFAAFYEWAIVNGYSDGLTIDRIDTNGNYEPSNCRWATNKEQANNRRTNNLITYNGETHTITEWAEKLGFKRITLANRINVYGWSVEKALTTPIIR